MMGGKGSGPLKRCAICKEPLVCAACGADQNDKAFVKTHFNLRKERLDALKNEADARGLSLSELLRAMVGE